MIKTKHLILATSVEQALQAMQNASGEMRVLAGGTDLLLDLEQGRHPPADTLVDITAIPELKQLEICNQQLFIGAAVTHKRITRSALVIEHAQALAEACGLIGGPQVRNVATLGGNVAHALPAADGTVALMVMQAQAEIASSTGRRLVPLKEVFKGPGESTLDPREDLLLGFYLPLGKPAQASSFKRVMRPQGVAIAVLNCAAWLQREGEKVAEARISIGPSGPTPRRMSQAEAYLTGKFPDENTIQQAYQLVLDEASFRTSRHRATSEYRQQVVKMLLVDTINSAWGRSER
jgi:carbon-monoxide dehydrogenase medium subunit